MHDRDELIALHGLALRKLDVDGAGLELLAAEEVGETVYRDVGLDERGEDDGKDL